MSLNISAIRNETLATTSLIHLNNAGASLIPDLVVEGVKKYIDYEAGHGGYETAVVYEAQLNQLYTEAARLIHCSDHEIAYTESATVAWQRAFHSIPFESGDVIWVCSTEYASNYISYLQLSKRTDITIKIIPNDPHGSVDCKAFAKLVSTDDKLISVCHMPTANGLINPVEKIGEIANEHNILYLVDACQSIGQYPVDVAKMKCDFLSVTGRKYLRGPRGTGFLYAREETTKHLEPLNLDLHGAEWLSEDSYRMRNDAKKYETWESNLAAKYGLALALEYVNKLGIEEIRNRIIDLAALLRSELRNISHIEVHDTGMLQSGIVTFTSAKLSPNDIKIRLSKHGINVSVVVASSAILDLKVRKIPEAVRASVHYYNTKAELGILITHLKDI